MEKAYWSEICFTSQLGDWVTENVSFKIESKESIWLSGYVEWVIIFYLGVCIYNKNRTDSVLTELMNMVMTTLKSAIYIHPKMKEVYTKILPIIDNDDLSNIIKIKHKEY